MLFNSIDFIVFLAVVFVLYWNFLSKTKNVQNIFLTIASFTFYIFWDWRFSLLLIFSVLLNYYGAILVENQSSSRSRSLFLTAVVVLNIVVLGFFKYYNFFANSASVLFSKFGLSIDVPTLSIILPIGISFYTFHGLSYIIDVYYKRIKTHRNLVDYTLFVTYFPLLVAGPIERATHLLPQLKVKREFSYIQCVQGLELILWGFLKKLVIADSLAPFVSTIFDNSGSHNSTALILGAIAFAFQVYGDFSGYTDIARGVSRLFGIELLLNFSYPYFSRSIPEFWSRWHISLSSWLNDYVFMPIALKYRDYGKHGIFLAVFSTFLVSGIWHGAAWHFIAWGAFHGLLYLPFIYKGKGLRSMFGKRTENYSLRDLPSILLTFSLVLIGYIMFRANSLTDAMIYYKGLFTGSLMEVPNIQGKTTLLMIFVFILILLIIEFKGRHTTNPISHIANIKSRFVRWSLYSLLLFVIGMYMNNNVSAFIYFQF